MHRNDDFSHILKRFPTFELSYETISHKKVSSYDICLAVPLGKKSFLWFTFHENQDVCYLLDLNKEQKIHNISQIKTTFDPRLSLGTVLYGSLLTVQEKSWFIVEDIYFFKDVSLKHSKMLEKLAFLEKVMEATNRVHQEKDEVIVMLPFIYQATEEIPHDKFCYINYPVHHVQYRSTHTIMPYLNVNINKKISVQTPTPRTVVKPDFDTVNSASFVMDFSKTQYKYPTVFQVTADIQFDIYHLFAYGKKHKPVYYGIAYVPNYKCSVFLNGLFRNIRENKNLDYIEESEDEEDFQKTEEDKYVDLKKVLLMECVFNYKYKRWVPMKVVDHRSTKIIHIDYLVKY